MGRSRKRISGRPRKTYIEMVEEFGEKRFKIMNEIRRITADRKEWKMGRHLIIPKSHAARATRREKKKY